MLLCITRIKLDGFANILGRFCSCIYFELPTYCSASCSCSHMIYCLPVRAQLNYINLKPQSHRPYDQVTTYLRAKMLESWANRRKDVRQVVGDRQGKISRSKVAVMLKPSHTRLTTRYDVAATKTIRNHRQIAERTYDWSQRSWVIARGKSVATRSMVMFKTCNLRFQILWYHE